MSDSKRTILITGGNLPGLGWYIAKALLLSPAASYHVIITTRTDDKGKEGVEKLREAVPDTQSSVDYVVLDLESDESIAKAFETVKSRVNKIDVLVNNAGAQFDPQWTKGELSTRQLWQRTYDINVTGAQIVTETFLPLILAGTSPRIIFMSSGIASLEASADQAHPLNVPPPAGYPKEPHWTLSAYRAAKCGLNFMMREWHRELGNDNVKVFSVEPGLLATALGGYSQEVIKAVGAENPAVGAETLLKVIEGERDADAGKHIGKHGVMPW